MNTKNTIITIVTAALLIYGILLLSQRRPSVPSTGAPGPGLSTSESSSLYSRPDWANYRNEQYGFGIQFPREFAITKVYYHAPESGAEYSSLSLQFRTIDRSLETVGVTPTDNAQAKGFELLWVKHTPNLTSEADLRNTFSPDFMGGSRTIKEWTRIDAAIPIYFYRNDLIYSNNPVPKSEVGIIWADHGAQYKLENSLPNNPVEDSLLQDIARTFTGITATNRTPIVSPDGTKKVYLEKQYNPSIDRYVRQSVILENVKTAKKTIVEELMLTAKEAQKRYAANGDCVSDINFDEFEPVRWVNNDLFLVDQISDNYECAGAVSNLQLYNGKGASYFSKPELASLDYSTDMYNAKDYPGFSILNVCHKDNVLVLPLSKTGIFGGYSLVEFDPAHRVLKNQVVESSDLFHGEEGQRLQGLNCPTITSPDFAEKYFQPKK